MRRQGLSAVTVDSATQISDVEQIWAQRAKELVSWDRSWASVLKGSFLDPPIRWFSGGKLNISYNCLDRHLQTRGEKTALIWQGEQDDEQRSFTYRELHYEVSRVAKVLLRKGISRGDCVTLYLPMIPELVITLLACARIGAVHCVVFSGFSSHHLRERMLECGAKMLITADGVFRGGKNIPLKTNGDEALDGNRKVTTCMVVQRTGKEVRMMPGRDCWYHDEIMLPEVEGECKAVSMDSDDTLFYLYTSGSAGRPKCVSHTVGGYFVYALSTCKDLFTQRENDVFWCTADIGWITGHTYSIYGPLGLGGTTFLYEGVPVYPAPDRFWQLVERFKVSQFYTAPTVIRALMRFGSEPVRKYDLSSLRLLGSVGEVMNPEAWRWYFQHVGGGKLPIIDTWWQTETGGVITAPEVDLSNLTPGSVGKPLPGIDIVVVDELGDEVDVGVGGRLIIRKPWPGLCKDVGGGIVRKRVGEGGQLTEIGYDSGDGARRDENGNYWILGRLDDVINVCGHRLGTAEIEAALLSHTSVAEAAVVGMPDSLKGQAVYAYVTLNDRRLASPLLLEELRQHVRKEIGPIASPDGIQFAPGLPKTRSGKIMRRILRKIAADEFDALGDTSTLADPSLVDDLIEGKKSEAHSG